MQLLFLLVICVASALAEVEFKQREPIRLDDFYNNVNFDNRIIDGNPAPLGKFKWQAGVIFTISPYSYLCGGALIANQWVLTAAHCAQGASSFTIILGDISLSGSASTRVVDNTNTAYVHPNYNSANLNNDIALIKLSHPITYNSNIGPICLPNPSSVIGAGEIVKVSGWGVTRTGDISDILLYTKLTTISNQQCASVFGTQVVVSSTICTVGNPYNSTCSGDSGGPLIICDDDCGPILIGVVSFGAAAGCTLGYPAGFTRVEPYLTWICNVSGVCSSCPPCP